MAINHPKAVPNSVPAYQLSGIPYVTGSVVAGENLSSVQKQFDFPYVTRFITLVNYNSTDTENLHVAFSAEGLSGTPDTGQKNFFVVKSNSDITLDVRCKTVFISSTNDDVKWSMCAGLTTIPADQFPILTGSNGFEGVGGAAS